MSAADIEEILRLPTEEHLRLCEVLWASLAARPNERPLGSAHITEIDDAVRERKRNPRDVMTLDEVLAEARRG